MKSLTYESSLSRAALAAPKQALKQLAFWRSVGLIVIGGLFFLAATPLLTAAQTPGGPILCRPGIIPQTSAASFSSTQSDAKLAVTISCPAIGANIALNISDPWIVVMDAKRSSSPLPYWETWTITYRVRENDSNTERKGWIKFAQGLYYGVLNITQKAKVIPITGGGLIACPITELTPKSGSALFNSTGGSGSQKVTITCPQGLAVTATSSQSSWLVIESVSKELPSPSPLTQTWVIKYKVSANTTKSQRSGRISFSHPKYNGVGGLDVSQKAK